jgi:hypothetical protein
MSTHATGRSALTSTRTASNPVDGFLSALGSLLARYELVVERRYLQVSDTGRKAHVLVSR